MVPINTESGSWNGREWVQRRVAPATNSDIHVLALWSISTGNFIITEQLCRMADAVLADPPGQRQLPFDSVRLNELFDYALDVEASSVWPDPRWSEGIEIDAAPRAMEFPGQDAPPMSMDHGLPLVDACIAGQPAGTFNDASGINSGPERNKRRFEEVECDEGPRQVKFRWHEQRNEDSESGNAILADRHGHSPLATGVGPVGGTDDISPDDEMSPAQEQEQEHECRAAVAEPDSQAPCVAGNGVALRLPQFKLPSDNQGATASGSPLQKMLNENASKATPKSMGVERNLTPPGRADKPSQEIRCEECSESEGRPVTFKSERSLRRHLTATKKHNAPPILRCRCGTEVVRKDAMNSHLKYCELRRGSDGNGTDGLAGNSAVA